MLLIQILRSDVDLFIRKKVTKKELRDREKGGLYPPRLYLPLTSSQEHAPLDVGKIKIKGTSSCNLEYNIHLGNLRTGGLLGC